MSKIIIIGAENLAVNTSLLMANWHTGEYIVEFEQKGETRAKYGDALLAYIKKSCTFAAQRLKWTNCSNFVTNNPQ